jgi:hypothetical protein
MRTFLLYFAALAACAFVIRLFLRPRAPASSTIADDGPDEDLVLVASSPNPIVIDAYRGALESAQIPVVVFDEATSRMLGRAPAVAMRLMVPENRLEEARSVLRELESGTPRDPDVA